MTALDSVSLSPACGAALHRTLRIRDDGGDYPLPPSLGPMAAHVVDSDELVVPMLSALARIPRAGVAAARAEGGDRRDGPPARDDVGVLACAAPMKLGAGGRMRQEIYADEHGIDTWEAEPLRTVPIDLVDALAFEALTGRPAPPPVVDAQTYTRFGLPWFDLIEPTARDVAAAERLASVCSIADLEVPPRRAAGDPRRAGRGLLRLRAQRAA
jgi:hypothetical protein